MTFVADRKNENLEWFIFREKLYHDREAAVKDIKSGCITINGKVKKDPTYIVKKGDQFVIVGTPADGCRITFTVDACSKEQ